MDAETLSADLPDKIPDFTATLQQSFKPVDAQTLASTLSVPQETLSRFVRPEQFYGVLQNLNNQYDQAQRRHSYDKQDKLKSQCETVIKHCINSILADEQTEEKEKLKSLSRMLTDFSKIFVAYDLWRDIFHSLRLSNSIGAWTDSITAEEENDGPQLETARGFIIDGVRNWSPVSEKRSLISLLLKMANVDKSSPKKFKALSDIVPLIIKFGNYMQTGDECDEFAYDSNLVKRILDAFKEILHINPREAAKIAVDFACNMQCPAVTEIAEPFLVEAACEAHDTNIITNYMRTYGENAMKEALDSIHRDRRNRPTNLLSHSSNKIHGAVVSATYNIQEPYGYWAEGCPTHRSPETIKRTYTPALRGTETRAKLQTLAFECKDKALLHILADLYKCTGASALLAIMDTEQ